MYSSSSPITYTALAYTALCKHSRCTSLVRSFNHRYHKRDASHTTGHPSGHRCSLQAPRRTDTLHQSSPPPLPPPPPLCPPLLPAPLAIYSYSSSYGHLIKTRVVMAGKKKPNTEHPTRLAHRVVWLCMQYPYYYQHYVHTNTLQARGLYLYYQ